MNNDATKNNIDEFESILSSLFKPEEQERIMAESEEGPEFTDEGLDDFLREFDQKYCVDSNTK